MLVLKHLWINGLRTLVGTIKLSGYVNLIHSYSSSLLFAFLVNYDRPSKDMQAHLRSDFVPNKRLPFKPNLDFERQELNSSEGRARKPRAEIDEPIDRTEQLRINQELEADLGIKSSVLQSKNEGNKVDPRRAIPSNTSNSRFLSNYVEMGRPPSPVWNHGIAYPENRKKPVINGTKGVRVTSEDQDEDIR